MLYLSFSIAVILPTLWLYLEHRFDADQWFFGVVFAAFCFSNLLSSPLFGFWVDYTQKTKTAILFANLFEIGGKLRLLIMPKLTFLQAKDLLQWCALYKFCIGKIIKKLFQFYNNGMDYSALINGHKIMSFIYKFVLATTSCDDMISPVKGPNHYSVVEQTVSACTIQCKHCDHRKKGNLKPYQKQREVL